MMMQGSPAQSRLSDNSRGVRLAESEFELIHQSQVRGSAWIVRCLELLHTIRRTMCCCPWIRFYAELGWKKVRRSMNPVFLVRVRRVLSLRSYMLMLLCVDAWCVQE